jgi:hypothetical protein
MALIRSIAYPFTLDNGGLKLAEDNRVYFDRIKQVIETRPLERVMNPGYGAPDFVFTAPQSAEIVAQRVTIALERSLPELGFQVGAELDESGGCSLTIDWQINGVDQDAIQYKLQS